MTGEAAELVDGGEAGGLVVVHAHPDDETLSTGALIASFAAAGEPVTVVTCTRGERGEVLALPGTTSEGLAHLEGDGPALAAHREQELAAALQALGGGDAEAIRHRFLDQLDADGAAAPGVRYEDSGMVWVRPGVAGPDPSGTAGFAVAPLDEAAARLAALLREQQPDIVATYEVGGGYGHPDHVRAHEVTVRALELAGIDADLWLVATPAEQVRRDRRELAASELAQELAAAHGLTFPDAEGELPPFAHDVPQEEFVAVDASLVLDRVLAALAAHATQLQHVTRADAWLKSAGVLGMYALSDGVLAPLRGHETYLVATHVGSAG